MTHMGKSTKDRCLPTSKSSSPIFWHGGCVVDFPTSPTERARVPVIQMQLSSQSIEESCESFTDLRIHALIPVLARPHARGASRRVRQRRARCSRTSISESSDSSPSGSEYSWQFAAIRLDLRPLARAASDLGSGPVGQVQLDPRSPRRRACAAGRRIDGLEEPRCCPLGPCGAADPLRQGQQASRCRRRGCDPFPAGPP